MSSPPREAPASRRTRGERLDAPSDVAAAMHVAEKGGIGRRSVAVNAAFLMASQAVTWLLAFLIAIVLPRYLGPASLGQFRLGTSLWAVAGVLLAFGTPILLTKEFSRDRTRAGSLLGPALVLQLLAYGACWLGMAVFVAAAGYGSEVVVLVGIIGISMVFTPFSGNARSALYGLERMEFVAYSDVATKVVQVGAILAVILMSGDVRAVAGVNIIYALVSAALLIYFLRRFEISWRPKIRGLREVARRSRSYMAVDVTLVAYQQIDVIVISLFVQHDALGWYATADGLVGSLLFVPSILMTSLFPVFSRLHVAHPDELVGLLRRSFNFLLLLAVPIGFGTIAVATPVSLQLFGREFLQTGPVLAVMGVVLMLTYLTILLGRYAIAIDRQHFWVRLMVGATVATVALDVVFVPWTHDAFGNGAIGGALAYVVTESVMLGIGVWKLAPGLVDRTTLLRMLKCAFAGVVMVIAVWPVRWEFFMLPIVVGVVSYGLMVLLLRIPAPDEIDMVRTAGGRLVARLPIHGKAAR